MRKDRYTADIDEILTSVFKKEAKTLAAKNVIPYNEELLERGMIKKIAYDLYRVDNDPYHNLWLLEDVDGKPYLVRASDPQFETNGIGDWTVTSDYDRQNVTLAYKNTPIARFSSKEYQFSPEDVITFKSAIMERIENDEDFVKEVFAEQPESKRSALVSTFPELKKFV